MQSYVKDLERQGSFFTVGFERIIIQHTKIERLLRATFSTLTRGPSWPQEPKGRTFAASAVMNRYEARSSTAGSTGSKSFLWKLRLRSGEYSSVKKFQAPAEFRYEAACYTTAREKKGATAANQRARHGDDKNGKLNRPHCYARVNEYIRSRSFLFFLQITTDLPPA